MILNYYIYNIKFLNDLIIKYDWSFSHGSLSSILSTMSFMHIFDLPCRLERKLLCNLYAYYSNCYIMHIITYFSNHIHIICTLFFSVLCILCLYPIYLYTMHAYSVLHFINQPIFQYAS